MKSVIMALFLFSVSLGNVVTAVVNNTITIESGVQVARETLLDESSAAAVQTTSFDSGDEIVWVKKDAEPWKLSAIRLKDMSVLEQARERIGEFWNRQDRLPSNEEGQKQIAGLQDQFGTPLRYLLLNSKNFHIYSAGVDKVAETKDDAWIKVTRTCASVLEQKLASENTGSTSDAYTWLERRQAELDFKKAQTGNATGGFSQSWKDYLPKREPVVAAEIAPKKFESIVEPKIGGDVTLKGAGYFWFFTRLMLGTAALFIVVAFFYKPKTYIQGDDEEEAKESDEQ